MFYLGDGHNLIRGTSVGFVIRPCLHIFSRILQPNSILHHEGLHHLLRPPGPGRRRQLQRLHRRRLHHRCQALFGGEHCCSAGRSHTTSMEEHVHKIRFDLQGILVGGLCPGAEDPAECEAALPGLWAGIAAILWPGYWDPTVSQTVNVIDSSHLC